MTTITNANIRDLVGTYLRNPQELPEELRNISISAWDVSRVTDMRGLFNGSHFNQPLNDWDVSNVTDMSEMFYEAENFDNRNRP